MKKSELKNYIRENIISTLSESIEDETKALDDYESKLDDVIKKKQEAGIEEDATPKGEDFFYDYLDIGMSYLEGFGKKHSLDDSQLEKLGKKIVDQLYKGDVGKAYDAIVKRGVMKEQLGSLTDEPLSALRKMGTSDMNLWHVLKLIDAGILKDSEKMKALKALDPNRPVNEDEEPSKADLKKTKGLAKAKEELALLTREMKSLAKKYSKAEGEEKEKLVADLKKKTKLKKELEAIIDK